MTRRPSASPRVLAVAAGFAIAALALAGCSAPEPQTSATPTRSATPTAAASEPAEETSGIVVVAGQELRVLDGDGSTSLALAYSTDPAEAVRQLSAALGSDPTTDVITDDPCNPQLDESSWGGLHLWSSVEGVNKPQGAQFYVTADAATTDSDLPIETPGGSRVGDTEQDARAADIDAPSFDDGADLHYDIVSGDASSAPEEYYGAAATIADGEVAELRSPVFYFFEC